MLPAKVDKDFDKIEVSHLSERQAADYLVSTVHFKRKASFIKGIYDHKQLM